MRDATLVLFQPRLLPNASEGADRNVYAHLPGVKNLWGHSFFLRSRDPSASELLPALLPFVALRRLSFSVYGATAGRSGFFLMRRRKL
jgi:hypothetical protein